MKVANLMTSKFTSSPYLFTNKSTLRIKVNLGGEFLTHMDIKVERSRAVVGSGSTNAVI